MYHCIERLPIFWWYTICLIMGITTAFYLSPTYALCGGAFLVLFACWINEYYPTTIHHISPYIVFCCAGYILLYTQITKHRIMINTYANIPLQCKGIVIDAAPAPHLPLKHKITVRVQALSSDAGAHWQKISGRYITIHTKKSYESLVGSDIMVNDITIKPSSQSYELFCIRTGLIGSIHKPRLMYTMIHRPFFSLTRYIHTYKRRMLNFFKHRMNTHTFTFFSALFLGNNDLVKESLKRHQTSFQHWGIMHYLARSGLHLVIVTGLLEYMLRLLPWSFTFGRIITLSCAFLYGLLSWASLSFCRALTVFAVTHMARISRRPHHFLHIILLTCSLFLVFNPITLFFLDFQLTFGITTCLGLFNYATYTAFI